MRALVTGGAGFIGSHLVDRLLRDGHDVAVIDDLSTGRLSNFDSVRGHPRLVVHEADVAAHAKIRPLFQGVDRVFHLAALADIVPSVSNPQAYYHVNVTGTFSVLEAARLAGVRRFVYAASSSCYGIPDVCPTPETADMRPQYPYALTKYLGEQLTSHWHQVYGLRTVSLRFFNVYGPRSRSSGTYGAVLGVFLAQKLAGQPFTVVGDGSQTRDFTFVSDVVAAMVAAADSDIAGEAFNVGSGGTYSVNQIVALLGGDVVHIPKRPGEPDCTFGDIRKIRRVLGWKPSVSLDEGVGVLLDHIDDWRAAPVWTPETIADATKDWFALLGARNHHPTPPEGSGG